MNIEPERYSKPSRERYSYSWGERTLIVAALLIFLLMSYLYIADVSIKRWLFPGSTDALLAKPIGRIIKKKGSVMRQRANDFEFTRVTIEAALYPNDTIMTGPESSVTVELIDGQSFELNPSSLVKLAFGNDFLAGGVVNIDILQGTSSIKSKNLNIKTNVVKNITKEPATPRPIPLAISAVLPADKTVYAFSVDEFLARKKKVPLSFRVNQNVPITIHIYSIQTKDKTRLELTNVAAPIEPNGSSTITANFSKPGTYEWEIHDASGRILSQRQFTFDRYVQAIETLPTLANNRLDGAATRKSFEGFLLKWKPVRGSGKYIVKISKAKSKQVLTTKEISANQVILNKDNLLLGQLEYYIEKDTGDGFIATSAPQVFGFEFLPPALVGPEDNALYDAKRSTETNGVVFFTWAKTNYTDQYELEIANDAEFKNIATRKPLTDNYLSIASPLPGTYYWRVRAHSHGFWSSFSAPRKLIISQ